MWKWGKGLRGLGNIPSERRWLQPGWGRGNGEEREERACVNRLSHTLPGPRPSSQLIRPKHWNPTLLPKN